MARRKDPSAAPTRKPSDGGAVLLQGAGNIGPVGPNGEVAGAALEVDRSLVILVDSRAIVDVVRRAVLNVTRDHLYAGKRPDGGPQRPLSQRSLGDPRRVSDKRGVRTGHLADELRAKPITGTTAKAESVILPPPNRNVFLATEKSRGIKYLGVGPAHLQASERAMSEAIAAMMEGRKVEPEQGEPDAAGEGGDAPTKSPADQREAARRGWETRRKKQRERENSA